MQGRSIAILHDSHGKPVRWTSMEAEIYLKKKHTIYLGDDSSRELQVQRAWGRSKLKVVRNLKKGTVVETQWARNRMTGIEARQVGRSHRTLLIIVRTLGSALGTPRRHVSFKISFRRQ